MSTMTICEPVQKAKSKTEAASRSFRQWLARREERCSLASQAVEMSMELATAWKDAVAAIDKAVESGAVEDFLEIGDMIYPYIENSNLMLAFASQMRSAAAEYECPSAFSSAFDRAVLEMAAVTEYVENFPRSEPEQWQAMRVALDDC